MKNNHQDTSKTARSARMHKAAATDILVIPEVVQNNQQRLTAKPRRKRRTNYAKKIMNDPFIFNV